jgi:Ice-binding-like
MLPRRVARFAARLVVVLPFAALVPAACGGFDTIDEAAGGDAGHGDAADTSTNEASTDARAVDGAGDAGIVRPDPRLRSLVNFAVFAGSTVSNAFATFTMVTGDLGTFPDKTAIGPTAPLVVGNYHLGDGVAGIAALDIAVAYDGLTPAKMPGCKPLTGLDLGGMTLAPGIYCFDTSAQLTGALILDAGGNPDAEWFFQIGSTLTTGSLGASPASVTVVGASPCRVYWQVGTSATLGTGTRFSGNILASSAITLITGTTIEGRALAFNAAVTMDTNTVSIAACP